MKAMLCASALLLAGACTDNSPATPEADAPAAPRLELNALAAADGQGLNGELGCSFRAGEDTLLVATGFVASQDHSEAAAKRNGAVVRLVATEAGGFDGLDDGAVFEGEGLNVEVRPGARRDEPGSEQVTYSATLLARGDNNTRSYEGAWTCGP